jgi:hypothetical protein
MSLLRTEHPRLAICCGQPLSEWFIYKSYAGWGMRCLFCERVWPFLTHAEFASQGVPKEQGK